MSEIKRVTELQVALKDDFSLGKEKGTGHVLEESTSRTTSHMYD